jgi:hypothetical protein
MAYSGSGELPSIGGNPPDRPTGTAPAILEVDLGGVRSSACRCYCAVLSPGPADPASPQNGWGGARNRADRTSDAITAQQAQTILAAADRARKIGLPFNRFITLHFTAMGIADCDASKATGRYLKWLADHARSRGGRIAALFIRENDEGDGSKGSHVHILAHVPDGVNLSALHRRWGAKLARCKYVRRSIRTRRIGASRKAWRTSPEAYLADLDRVLAYCLKGASPAVGAALGLARSGEGGRIVGKRVGRSENLRPASN